MPRLSSTDELEALLRMLVDDITVTEADKPKAKGSAPKQR